MCVEGESPTTNNFLNTRAKALSCNDCNEPKGSLSIPGLASSLTPGNVRSTLRASATEDVKQGKKRRDFFAGQGKPKRPPGDVLQYVEGESPTTNNF